MKTISISTATFAAIWAARQSGEDTEEQILARLLGASSEPGEVAAPKPQPKVMLHKQKVVKPAPVVKPVEDKPAKTAANCMSTADLDLLS